MVTYSRKKLVYFLLAGWGFFFIPFLGASQTIIPGESYFDETGYVEYIGGDLPIIISVPHGGYLEPADIPDRDCAGCSYLRDSYTQELVRKMMEEFVQQIGGHPHMIINLLHRRKFDANRDIGDAADGNPTVELAWQGYHEFIEQAKTKVEQQYGRGLFIDLHGHGHAIQRLELGYLLNADELSRPASQLNTAEMIQESSIRSLVNDNQYGLSHAELLQSSISLGSLIHKKGYPAVPSKEDRYPYEGQPFFNGGFNTRTHSSVNGGNIDGIQIECNQDVRFSSSIRNQFAKALTQALNEYYDIHYDEEYLDDFENPILDVPKETLLEIINVYPNPVTKELNLESTEKRGFIIIYSGVGQRVFSAPWQGNTLDVSQLNEGLYHLRFFTHDGKLIQAIPFIKQ